MAKSHWEIRLQAEAPIPVSSDNPYRHDSLGFKESATRLASLMEKIQPPFTIGIYGEWGSGKTSFMRLLQASLVESQHFTSFWFDAWVYENEDSLLLPLLSKLSTDTGKKQHFKTLKKLATAVLLTGSNAALKIVTLGTTGLKDAEHSLGLCEEMNTDKIYDKWVDQIEELRKEFVGIVDTIRGDKSSVVIFIDDLDRCIPENVVRLIENLKHFLSVKDCKCVFVIGVDKEVLHKGIQARYGTNLVDGNEYLEKIINLGFHVPRSLSGNKQFLIDTFRNLTEETWFQKLSEEVNQFTTIVSATGIKNPRRARILIQRYLFFLALENHSEYIPEIVIKLIIYKEFFPEAYNWKKEKKRLDYYPDLRGARPNTREQIPLTFDEIKNASCEDFAKIATNPEYQSLAIFTPPLGWLVSRFDPRTNLKNEFQSTRFDGNFPKDELAKLIDGKYKTSHSDYFDLVEFLFSFG